jgi:hypothetical protein
MVPLNGERAEALLVSTHSGASLDGTDCCTLQPREGVLIELAR